MRTQQLRGILILAGIIVSAMIYNAITPKPPPVEPELHQTRLAYKIEQVQLQRNTLQRNDTLKFYGVISVLAAINLSLLIIAGGIARAKVKRSGICTAQIGQHSTIPVRYKDLPRFYPIAVNLSLAEIEASVSSSHDQAYQISRQMIQDMTDYTRALAGGQERHPFHAALGPGQTALPISTLISTPTFAGLLRTGTLAPGKPLIPGYAHGQPQHGQPQQGQPQQGQPQQGQPQYRELQDLKSVAVAGWQGSGKTLSMAYLIASSVLAYGVRVYVIDPHKRHQESLGYLIQPLTRTGLVTVMNPFDTPALIQDLNTILDRRLSGQESNKPGILLVIDELARLAKLPCFDDLITFLDRCTEETRKANITFFGSSPKWTARHFKGRADIRGCMNSMLIHKTKPSQADLLLEDAQDKNLVKQLQRPGEAILATDYAPPVVITIPYCCRQDMETVAEIIGKRNFTTKDTKDTKNEEEFGNAALRGGEEGGGEEGGGEEGGGEEGGGDYSEKERFATRKPARKPTRKQDTRRLPEEVIPLAAQRQKHHRLTSPAQLTVEMIVDQMTFRKQQQPGFTQAEVARQAGMSAGTLSRILNGRVLLKDEHKRKLHAVLFAGKQNEQHALTG